MSLQNILPKVQLDERRFILRREKNYTIPSLGLILGWKVLTPLSNHPVLLFNGHEIRFPSSDPYYFSIKELREYCRSIVIPETEEETQMDILEMSLYNHQLDAIQYYPSLSMEELSNSIFTKEIKPITFHLPEDAPDEIEVSEQYYNRGTNINEITDEPIPFSQFTQSG